MSRCGSDIRQLQHARRRCESRFRRFFVLVFVVVFEKTQPLEGRRRYRFQDDHNSKVSFQNAGYFPRP
jgi:hypothetical protein